MAIKQKRSDDDKEIWGKRDAEDGTWQFEKKKKVETVTVATGCPLFFFYCFFDANRYTLTL